MINQKSVRFAKHRKLTLAANIVSTAKALSRMGLAALHKRSDEPMVVECERSSVVQLHVLSQPRERHALVWHDRHRSSSLRIIESSDYHRKSCSLMNLLRILVNTFQDFPYPGSGSRV